MSGPTTGEPRKEPKRRRGRPRKGEELPVVYKTVKVYRSTCTRCGGSKLSHERSLRSQTLAGERITWSVVGCDDCGQRMRQWKREVEIANEDAG